MMTDDDVSPSGARDLGPADHLELLRALLEPGEIELARRWVAALMVVPKEEREAVVSAVEQRIGVVYPPDEEPREPTEEAGSSDSDRAQADRGTPGPEK